MADVIKTPLLLLKQSPRKLAQATRTTMLGEDFLPVDVAGQALKLVDPKIKQEGRLFVLSPTGPWVVLAEHDEALSLALASAIAGESGGSGYFLQPGDHAQVALYEIVDGTRTENPAELAASEAQARLMAAGIEKRMLDFVAREHLAHPAFKAGQHDDIILGFKVAEAVNRQKTEVQRALAEEKTRKHQESLSLETFLNKAIGNPRARAIAQAQIQEQLKKDSFSGSLELHDPQPEGHYCERFDAESFSFTSNGPYVWFDWRCEAACEPTNEAERAFPDCTLRFALEKSEEL